MACLTHSGADPGLLECGTGIRAKCYARRYILCEALNEPLVLWVALRFALRGGGGCNPAKSGVRDGVKTARFGPSFGQPGELGAAFPKTKKVFSRFSLCFPTDAEPTRVLHFCIWKNEFSSVSSFSSVQFSCPTERN